MKGEEEEEEEEDGRGNNTPTADDSSDVKGKENWWTVPKDGEMTHVFQQDGRETDRQTEITRNGGGPRTSCNAGTREWRLSGSV